MTDSFFPVELTRTAFGGLPQRAAHMATQAPDWAEVFTPDGHEGALDPNRPIVIGDRGTGKSFWSSVLTHTASRLMIASRYPRLKLDKVSGSLGFSDAAMAAGHPDPALISDLMAEGYTAEELWRAVTLKYSPHPPASIPDTADWRELTKWVRADPSRRNLEFRELDEKLAADGSTYVIVFDALDVVADNWVGIRTQIEGLIKLTLAVRSTRRIRVKMFIRPDMADDRRLWMVGDASKLRQDEVLLRWTRRDLYGLLWTNLANQQNDADEDSAATFRSHCLTDFGFVFELSNESWRPPRQLLNDEDSQQQLFRALAGDYMGAGANKGDTYKWVPNHLSDAAGNAAPRSFILAMRAAAESSKSHDLVLDKSGIENGVRKASSVRIQELGEDYRWMEDVLGSMNGLIVPITKDDLVVRWQHQGVLARLLSAAEKEANNRRFIPPGDVLEAKSEMDAYLLLIEELKTLRIFLEIPDGRINMPDLFRVEAKVKRKGGMRPRG